MPKSIQIKELAFEFSGNVRVFSAVTKMQIDAKPDREKWEFANGRIGWRTRYVRLQFLALVDDQRQISGPDTSYDALVNAIEDSTVAVYFYPRYRDGAGTLHDTNADRYEVSPAWDALRIFDAPRVGISPAAKQLAMQQVDTLETVPGWASRG